MTLTAGLVLIAVVLVVVAWPFFRAAGADGSAGAAPDALSHWEHQKLEAYGAIKDAEFDLQTGKLSDADFQFIRDKYGARALEAIAALEQAKPKSRETGRSLRFLYCPSCGNKLPPRSRFCPGCGRGLRADDAA